MCFIHDCAEKIWVGFVARENVGHFSGRIELSCVRFSIQYHEVHCALDPASSSVFRLSSGHPIESRHHGQQQAAYSRAGACSCSRR